MSFLLKNIDDGEQDYADVESDCFDSINYVLENNNFIKTYELILKLWEFRQSGGGLHKELIELMVECGLLIRNGVLKVREVLLRKQLVLVFFL